MMQKRMKDVRRGEFFRVSASENGKVYIRQEYDRSEKKYWCQEFDDASSGRYFKADRMVCVGFTF